jgi:two-component system chemotaxis response regulator CheB
VFESPARQKSGAIRVLVIDDSAVVRETLKEVIESDSGLTVMGCAPDPIIAAQMLESDVPDVITLDIEMPRMDGLSFLRLLMAQHPLPVVICSSQTEEGSSNSLRALDFGAVDIIQKPKVGTRVFIEESRALICDTIKAAYQARGRLRTPNAKMAIQPKYKADVILDKPHGTESIDTTEKIVVVGASTGGTEALREFLEILPVDCPGIVVVQHMPEHFTTAFANRLDQICSIRVKEAEPGDSVVRGQALIAPGNHHCLLKRSGARYFVEIKDGPLVSRHRPSVDVLFRSAARYAGSNAIGIIMTGMGDDGAQGMLELKGSGAYTIAQDEASCVVFGMPKEAIKLGAVDAVLPLGQIAGCMLGRVGKMYGKTV